MSVPDPMTPPECDLRGLEYMPLLGQRLFGSEFDALSSDSEWRAGVTLWWAAWTQCPAASLPDDDSALCRLADLGRDLKAWKKVKERALHGFVRCSDGRLYHPTLAQQALLAWDKRQQDRVARSADADRKARERAQRAQMFAALKDVGVTPEWNVATRDLRDLVTRHCPSSSDTCHSDRSQPVTPVVHRKSRDTSRDMSRLRRDETGRDISSVTNVTGADAPIDLKKVAFDTGVAMLTANGLGEAKARRQVGLWVRERGEDWTVKAIVAAQGKADPVAYIQGMIRKAAADEGQGHIISDATRRRYAEMDAERDRALGMMAGAGTGK